MGAWSCLWAQGPSGAAPERAARLMDEAGKLADQHTGKAMEQAVADYRQAAPMWHELHDSQLEAKALEQAGVLSLRLGNLQPALENLSAALPLFRAGHDKAKEQVTLNNIGLVQSRLGKQRMAIETEMQSLGLAQEIGDRGEEAIVLNNLGLAYHELGEEPLAVEQFEKAARIQHELGNTANEGAAWSNLGAIHYTQGDLQESLEASNGRWRCASRPRIAAARRIPSARSQFCGMLSAKMRKRWHPSGRRWRLTGKSATTWKNPPQP